MKKYLAVEWLSFVPADQLSQLPLVSRAGGRLLDLVCRDDEGTLDTSVPIEELGQPRGHTCGVRNITTTLCLTPLFLPGARITSTSRERV